MELRITFYGEPILRETGNPVTTFDASLKQLARDMIETMHAAEGIGLAAQQIDRALMLCVIDVSHLDDEDLDYLVDGKRPPIDLIMPMALANPVVSILPGDDLRAEEGCLSFPGVRGDVTRAERIEVSYQDLDGGSHRMVAGGWMARVIQHEVDHLNGILFIDHMETRQKRMMDSKLKRLKRQSRDFIAGKNKT